jgi:hypothetical protein
MAVITERMLESSCAPITRIVAQTHPGKALCKVRRMMLRLAAGRDVLCRIGERLVSKGLSPSALGLAAYERQLPCGDDFRKYVVHLDSGSATDCKGNFSGQPRHFMNQIMQPRPR